MNLKKGLLEHFHIYYILLLAYQLHTANKFRTHNPHAAMLYVKSLGGDVIGPQGIVCPLLAGREHGKCRMELCMVSLEVQNSVIGTEFYDMMDLDDNCGGSKEEIHVQIAHIDFVSRVSTKETDEDYSISVYIEQSADQEPGEAEGSRVASLFL